MAVGAAEVIQSNSYIAAPVIGLGFDSTGTWRQFGGVTEANTLNIQIQSDSSQSSPEVTVRLAIT